MTNHAYFKGVIDKPTFSRQELMNSFRDGGFDLSIASFNKKLNTMLENGEILRSGRNTYYLPKNGLHTYSHNYSDASVDISNYLSESYPLLKFSIFEFVQLNAFINHQISNNVIFVQVEPDIIDFVFEALKEQFPGRVLLKPSAEVFHLYWSENMIVLDNLISEAPRNEQPVWGSRIEKILVDLFAEPLLKESISFSEYPTIFENAFSNYAINESSMFRYAKRRNAYKKILEFINKETPIILRTRGQI